MTRWHITAVTPHGMAIDWTRDYDDDTLLALMSALVNGDPWGAGHLRITQVVAA